MRNDAERRVGNGSGAGYATSFGETGYGNGDFNACWSPTGFGGDLDFADNGPDGSENSYAADRGNREGSGAGEGAFA